jgi:hypothetical protein
VVEAGYGGWESQRVSDESFAGTGRDVDRIVYFEEKASRLM